MNKAASRVPVESSSPDPSPADRAASLFAEIAATQGPDAARRVAMVVDKVLAPAARKTRLRPHDEIAGVLTERFRRKVEKIKQEADAAGLAVPSSDRSGTLSWTQPTAPARRTATARATIERV